MMGMHGVPNGVSTPPAMPALGPGETDKRTPGTVVLVLVFLAAFIVYYFVNWKLLSFVWKVG